MARLYSQTMDLDDIGLPNCPRCLVPMEATERNGVVVAECPECGLVQI